MITAATVPSWITAENAAPGSCQPNNSGAMRRWAVELMGRNSVIPCTIPRTTASSQLMSRATYRWLSPSGTHLPRVEILLLLGGQGIEPHAHRLQFEPGDLLVDVAGHRVHLLLQLVVVLDHPLAAERLIGEGHVHHRRGMTLSGGEVHQATLAEDNHPFPAFERVLLHVLADGGSFLGERAERVEIELDVEVAAVGDDRSVLHLLEVLLADDVNVAGRSA